MTYLYWLVPATILIVGIAAWGFFTDSGNEFFRKLFRRKPKDFTDLEASDRLSTAQEVGAARGDGGRKPYSIVLGAYLTSENVGQIRKNPEKGLIVAAEPTLPVLVFGPAGSGKTSGVLAPAIMEWGFGKGPVLAGTVKYDLADSTIGIREKVGKVGIFDPAGPTPKHLQSRLITWTPLTSAVTWAGAMRTAGAMVFAASDGKDSFWDFQTIGLLACLMFVTAQKPETSMATVSQLLGALLAVEGDDEEDDAPTTFQLITDDLSMLLAKARSAKVAVEKQSTSGELNAIDATVKINQLNHRIDEIEACEETLRPIFVTSKTAPQTIGGVIASCANALRVYSISRPNALIAWDDPAVFDIDKFVESNDTLYLIAPPRSQKLFAPILAAFASMVIDSSYNIAQSKKTAALDVPILICLDEVHAMPIDDLPTIFSTARSYNIQILCATQDHSQLIAKFGDTGAAELVDSSGSVLALPRAKDPKTLELLSMISGEVRVKNTSTTTSDSSTNDNSGDGGRQSGSSTSVTESWEYRPLLPPGRITSFTDWEAFAIVGSKRCQLLLLPWYKSTLHKRLADGDVVALQELGAGPTIFDSMPETPESIVDLKNSRSGGPVGSNRRRRRFSPSRAKTTAAPTI